MSRNPYARIEVEALLEKLGVRGRRSPDGRRVKAPCPAHKDKHPSWFIRDNPGEPYHAAHKCQGCGFAGGPIALVAEVLGLSDDQAREWLAGEMPLPPIPTEVELELRGDERRREFRLPSVVRLGLEGEFLDYYLQRAGKSGIQTKVALEQAELWALSHVPRSAVDEEGEPHRLRRRIVIPICSASGYVRGYTARAVAKNAYLRYLEPSSDEHAPDDAVFGEWYWTERGSTLVVVEGVFDAMAVEAAFWPEPPALAALRGSNPGPSEGLRFSEFERVVLLADADDAGRKARDALRGMLGRHVDVRVADLPQGQDPAEAGVAWLREHLGGMISGKT